MAFELPPRYWVDLDTLVETTAQGLRDAGVLAAKYAGLDAVVATKEFGEHTGVVITPLGDAKVVERDPGPALLDVTSQHVPRPGNRDAKRAWRDELAAAWAQRPPLEGSVWADVTFGITTSLLGPLEVVLDALEPVLGRDPRGRDWQEFFPNDDRIVHLRVRRSNGQPLRLRMGSLPAS